MKNLENNSIRNTFNSILGFIIPDQKIWFFPLFYLQIIAVAELLTTMREPRIGLVIHGLVMIALLVHGGFEQRLINRRFLLALALAPLIRLLSLSLPLSGRELLHWYLMVGAILFVASYFAARVIGLDGRRLGLTIKDWPLQVLFGLSGIGLGFIEFLILRPDPLVEEMSFQTILIPGLILAYFTGMLEEIIFRGIIQEASLASYGKFGITFGAVLFGILHVGYGSLADVIFVTLVAMLFGLFVLKTGSILGVSISHSLTNIFLLLIFPFYVGKGEVGPPPTSAVSISVSENINAPAKKNIDEMTGLIIVDDNPAIICGKIRIEESPLVELPIKKEVMPGWMPNKLKGIESFVSLDSNSHDIPIMKCPSNDQIVSTVIRFSHSFPMNSFLTHDVFY